MFGTKLLIGTIVAIEVVGAVYTLNKMGLLEKAKTQVRSRVNDFNDMVQETKTSFEDGLTNSVEAEVVS